MRQLLKRITPRPVLKHLRALAVSHNQRTILNGTDKHPVVFIEPVNRVEHYFHSIFDLTLPLWRLIKAAPEEVRFVVKEFGIFSDRLPTIFPGRVEVELNDGSSCKIKSKQMLGMNPQFVHLSSGDLENFKNHVCDVLGVDQKDEPEKVLLIERLPPVPYFVTDAVKKGAGASRRSIQNHSELASALKAVVRSPFEFQNIQLEKLPFREQVRLFNSAALVIGQHGAGLANCVWMHRKSKVVEISHDFSLRHFSAISRVMEHSHILHEVPGSHVSVDVPQFVSHLLTERELGAILCAS